LRITGRDQDSHTEIIPTYSTARSNDRAGCRDWDYSTWSIVAVENLGEVEVDTLFAGAEDDLAD
jgi:hypothetical protein